MGAVVRPRPSLTEARCCSTRQLASTLGKRMSKPRERPTLPICRYQLVERRELIRPHCLDLLAPFRYELRGRRAGRGEVVLEWSLRWRRREYLSLLESRGERTGPCLDGLHQRLQGPVISASRPSSSGDSTSRIAWKSSSSARDVWVIIRADVGSDTGQAIERQRIYAFRSAVRAASCGPCRHTFSGAEPRTDASSSDANPGRWRPTVASSVSESQVVARQRLVIAERRAALDDRRATLPAARDNL